MSYQTIDIRDWKQTGDDLKREILAAVDSTQSVVIRPLPNELVMTKAQFDALSGDSDMIPMQGNVGRVYVTPRNAMEVIVK